MTNDTERLLLLGALMHIEPAGAVSRLDMNQCHAAKGD
jgi:hypothetical protein